MRKIVFSVPSEHDILAAGASFNYMEISEMISSYDNQDIELIKLDAGSIIEDHSLFPKLGKDDVLLSNCGPFSWFYHMLREKKEMDFKIISDVQTALSHEYILDQSLIQDLKRIDDSTIFVSDYQYAIYQKLFPETIRKENSIICYPFMKTFPDINNIERNTDTLSNGTGDNLPDITLGWMSRLFDAKNFKDALNGYIRTCDDNPDLNIHMNVIGHADEPYVPQRVKKIIKTSGINPDRYSHMNNGIQVPHEKIWGHMKNMDVILFPSTGCMESLGRVILEASHTKIPVIAAHHGASAELMPETNLIDVTYNSESIDIIEANPLGSVNSEKIAESCGKFEKLALGNNSRYEDDHKVLRSLLMDGIENVPRTSKPDILALDNKVKRFIDSFELSIEGSYILKTHDARKKGLETLRKALGENSFDIVNMSLILSRALNFTPSVNIRD